MVGSSNARMGSVEIVSWGGGSYKQISKMLDAHYKGTIDISDYWEVGDIREELLYDVIGRSGISNTSDFDLPFIGSQTIKFVIIGFNHDDLVRPINGITKAAVTVQWLEPFSESFGIGEIMTSDTPNGDPWQKRTMREYMNNNVYNATPEDIRGLIKYVKKKSNTYGTNSISEDWTNQTNTTDRCFLLSTYEVFGENMFTDDYCTDNVTPSGTQYIYFQTDINIIKYVDNTAINWLLRGLLYNKGSRAGICVLANGNASNMYSNKIHLAPAFCL